MQPLEMLKQQAIEAKKNLYLPKLIKSANMELCWQGRIIRAHELANEALAAKDTAKVEVLLRAINGGKDENGKDVVGLQQAYDQAGADYDRALKAYVALGGDAKDLDVGECTCPFCERSKMQDAYFLAESRLRATVFDLTEPDEGGVPLPLALMSKGTDEAQKQAWALLTSLCNAQANYKRACEQFGKVPAWGYVLRAW